MQHRTDIMDKVVGIVFFAILAISFVRDYHNVQQGYCCDLRKRIVGARYQQAKLSPYFYKWQAGQPETLCIPSESGPLMQQNVVSLPPSYLWLLQPLAKLRFPLVQWIWLAVQYLLLLGVTAIFWWQVKDRTQKWLVLAVGAGMLLSKGWIYNVDIGQSYMVFPLLWAIGYALGNKTGRQGLWAGIVLALCCWLRPVCGMMIFPFLIGNQRAAFAKSFLITGALLVLQPLLCGQVNDWLDFFKSSRLWGEYYASLGANTYSDFGNGAWPTSIEGQSDYSITPQLPEYTANLPIVCRAVLGIAFPAKLGLALLVVAGGVLCYMAYLGKKANKLTASHIWLLAFMAYYAAELLLAIPKPSYYLVEMVFPLCLLAIASGTKKITFFLLFAGMLLSMLPSGIIPMHLLIGEYLLAIAIVTQIGSYYIGNRNFALIKPNGHS
jgi:hypothetical protein